MCVRIFFNYTLSTSSPWSQIQAPPYMHQLKTPNIFLIRLSITMHARQRIYAFTLQICPTHTAQLALGSTLAL